MQLRSGIIVINSQTQTQTQTQSKRTRKPSQKSIESKENQKALAAMDAQNLRQKLQTTQTRTKRIRTLSIKAIESQENQNFMESLDAEEESQQQSQTQTRQQTRYETRSNTTKTPYSISEFTQEFFNDSSEAWRANKIQKPNATFQYRCSERLKNGKRCAKSPLNQFHCQKHTK
jgi:Zn-dependent M32 family carboxypeptidase